MQTPHSKVRPMGREDPAAVRLRGAIPEAACSPADLAVIRSPVLRIWVSDDQVGSIEKCRAGASHFREVGTGHQPWLEEPEQSGELARVFLDPQRDLAD